jgi:chromosome segregation ATPase
MLRWFRRKRPHSLATDHRQLITDLVQSDDRLIRVQHGQALEDLLAKTLDASADTAQVAVWAMERRLQGYLQQQFGVTNEMVSDAVSGVGTLQGQLTALEGLFQQIGERVTGVEADVTDLKAWRGIAERKLSEHDQSRDRSIEERQNIQAAVDRIAERMNAFIASSEDEAQQYRALLDELLRERAAGTSPQDNAPDERG